MATPPAPPPLPPSFTKVCTDLAPPIPPVVAPNSSEASYSHLIELLTYSGAAFNDHWAYFVRRDAQHESVGVKIHATGDVRYGFRFEVKRSVDLTHSEEAPTKRIPLQWIEDAVLFDDAMWNDGVYMEDSKPACGLEAELSKVAPPGKSLTSIEEVCFTHGT